MSGTKLRVLLIGQDPTTVDFADPMLPYGFTVETVNESLVTGLRLMKERGWSADLLQVLADDLAASRIVRWLQSHDAYDCVVVGAGVRIPVGNLQFFESVVNAVHEAAPQAKIGFNTRPEDTTDAVERLLNIHH